MTRENLAYSWDNQPEQHRTPPVLEFGGRRSGPHLSVSVPRPWLGGISERLASLQHLPFMRGRLTIVADVPVLDDCDASLRLECDPSLEKDAYWIILGRMAGLGMIAGRGVPKRWLTNDLPGRSGW